MTPATVLVADDSPTVRIVLATQLGDSGYQVLQAEDGRDALDQLRSRRPDVALLDIDMPELDGLGVLDQMQREPELATTPVVFLTGRATAEDVAEGLARGAWDYLRKPVEPAELEARVRAALRMKALADELRERNAELHRLAATDHLTGLYNRRVMADELTRLAHRSTRHGRDLSVVMLDVDHFKRINDEHGHQAGDAVLIAIAQRILLRIRGSDLFGRWGGEEFLILLPETGASGASRLAEDVRAAVAADPVRVAAGAAIDVTVSAGWAAWHGDEPDELLRRADRALYAAKDAGRNAVRGDGPVAVD